ncbi:unnamed protein product [Ambrosiozyma monospora]|uniref:Unnamed protein product n=1 Tax=Ambrosiozyma monospora TaxID=43982 RepID=A0ACB5T6Z2_AMBMO|nr:unnamed protein product [Ambrosiozyma monospora]
MGPPLRDFSDFPHPSGPAPDFSGSFDGEAPTDTVLTSAAEDASNTAADDVAKRQVSEGAGNTVQAVVGLAVAGWMLALL